MTQQTQTKQLPKGWKEENLGSDNFKILGSGIKKFSGEKDYLSTESIKETNIEKIESKITYQKRPSRANMQPIINSVWFAKMKDTLKVYCFDELNKTEINKYILSTGFAGINSSVCEAKFIKYFFLSPNFNSQKDKFAIGTTQVAINNEGIKKITIAYPESKEEQSLIVSAIETHFSRLDNAIKNLKSVKEKIQLYRKAVLKKAFEKKEGWEEKRIKEVFIINPKKEEIKDLSDDLKVSFVPMKFVSEYSKKIVNNEIKKLSEVRKGYTYFKDEDVILAKITPCFENGKMAIAKDLTNGIGFGSTEFHIFRNKGDLIANYLFYFFQQDKFRSEAKRNMTGTAGQLRVPVRFIENYLINYPPSLQEQSRIVQEIESKFSVIDKVEEAVENSLKKAEMLKKAILKAAFEGRLVKEEGENE